MSYSNRLLGAYDGITRYAGVPTDQIYGRLHYNENLFGPSPKCLETLKELTPADLYLYESNERDDLLDALSEDLGIPAENITVSDLCTHCNENLFYSHRRDKGMTGAMASMIQKL